MNDTVLPPKMVAVPTWLISGLLATTLATIVGIGTYMTKWNIDDAAWKARVMQQLNTIDTGVDSLGNRQETHRQLGHPEILVKLESLEKEIDKLNRASHK